MLLFSPPDAKNKLKSFTVKYHKQPMPAAIEFNSSTVFYMRISSNLATEMFSTMDVRYDNFDPAESAGSDALQQIDLYAYLAGCFYHIYKKMSTRSTAGQLYNTQKILNTSFNYIDIVFLSAVVECHYNTVLMQQENAYTHGVQTQHIRDIHTHLIHLCSACVAACGSVERCLEEAKKLCRA